MTQHTPGPRDISARIEEHLPVNFGPHRVLPCGCITMMLLEKPHVQFCLIHAQALAMYALIGSWLDDGATRRGTFGQTTLVHGT